MSQIERGQQIFGQTKQMNTKQMNTKQKTIKQRENDKKIKTSQKKIN